MLVKIKLVLMQDDFYSPYDIELLRVTTRKSMNQCVIKSSVPQYKIVYNLEHVYASTSKHTIIDTIVSGKSTHYTL